MTPSQKLLERLRKELNLEIPVTAHIERTYTGHWQKSAGAWTWVLRDERPSYYMGRLGSQWSVSDLLKAHQLTVYKDTGYDYHIEPAREAHLNPEGQSLREIFWAELKKYQIEWCMGPGCLERQSHTRGFAMKYPIMCLGRPTGEYRLTVHLASSIATRKGLHRGLHEIGHLVNDERGMRRFEKEEAANQFAERRMRELGIPVPRSTAASGRQYVSRMRRWGQSISRSRRQEE